MTLEYNITGLVTKELIAAGSDARAIGSISMCNVHASDSVDIDIHIGKCSSKYYIIKNYTLSYGSTLILEGKEISFNNVTGEFGLFIKLNNSDSAVDVIMRR